ncbi:hypothetical protein QQY66_48320 [Streptomyces sp. DG2A-72]|uniref:hypothetical protein n=1 Tax=Streptomyces sp. DG2A-72 TaxID=3051386 RepID=UPI00265C277F|nr:hypothetical protein [Streptomyces sp. DG2A-72]MDO0939138.1 hypothetical protein [Streptomyces sp. DG2A-72]
MSAGGDLPLLIALAAEAATDGGAWAAVGLPQLGGLAAADAGLDLACGLAVPEPGRRWPEVLATVCEATPVVLLGPMGQVALRTSRRIAARLRRSGTTLLTWQDWPEAQLRLRVAEARWDPCGARWVVYASTAALLRARACSPPARRRPPRPGLPQRTADPSRRGREAEPSGALRCPTAVR